MLILCYINKIPIDNIDHWNTSEIIRTLRTFLDHLVHNVARMHVYRHERAERDSLLLGQFPPNQLYDVYQLVIQVLPVATEVHLDSIVYLHCPVDLGDAQDHLTRPVLDPTTSLNIQVNLKHRKPLIGVNRPAIVRKSRILAYFLHFCQNVPHFWPYFEITKMAENRNNFSCMETFCSKKLCENVNDTIA